MVNYIAKYCGMPRAQPVFEKEGLCIPLGGNIPLRGNAVCILFRSSERVGIF